MEDISASPPPIWPRALSLRFQLGIQAMPPAQSQCIELAFVHSASHQEISQAMALPLGTVKSHIRRGLESIRRGLDAPA